MLTPMRLYHHPLSSNSRRAVLTARYLALEIELVAVDLANAAHRSPEFLRLNPNGKVPVLDDDGFVLWESHAIMQYLANKTPAQDVYPRDAQGRADVDRWLFWSAAHFTAAVAGAAAAARALAASTVENRDDPYDHRGAHMVGRCLTLALALVSLGACREIHERMHEPTDANADADAAGGMSRVPARGTAATLDIASWNLEWFGDTAHGPTDETLQLRNARDVIGGTDFDLWGLAEIVSTEQFESLRDQLPGYEGLLANDARVAGGPAYYSDFGNLEQKVGLLYKASIFTVLSAAVILTQDDHAFAGRPPLEVKLRASLGGATQDMVVIVMHAKCCADPDSYQQRVAASGALKAYLDATSPTQKVWVIGDWNDDLTVSIADGQPSPYHNFIADRARYTIETEALSSAHVGSTVGYSSMIDHHMVSEAAAASYVAGSVEVYRVDAYVASYGSTTSDHYPVLTRYRLGAATDRGGGGEISELPATRHPPLD